MHQKNLSQLSRISPQRSKKSTRYVIQNKWARGWTTVAKRRVNCTDRSLLFCGFCTLTSFTNILINFFLLNEHIVERACLFICPHVSDQNLLTGFLLNLIRGSAPEQVLGEFDLGSLCPVCCPYFT
jgi:hypothetical protein